MVGRGIHRSLITKNRAPGEFGSSALPNDVADVDVVDVVVGDDADAEPARNTATVTPSENVTSVITPTAKPLRR
jgi:hypothetical protein